MSIDTPFIKLTNLIFYNMSDIYERDLELYLLKNIKFKKYLFCIKVYIPRIVLKNIPKAFKYSDKCI